MTISPLMLGGAGMAASRYTPLSTLTEEGNEVLKRALFYGGVMGSFAVERFGTERLQSLTREVIDARFQIFRELTHLE